MDTADTGGAATTWAGREVLRGETSRETAVEPPAGVATAGVAVEDDGCNTARRAMTGDDVGARVETAAEPNREGTAEDDAVRTVTIACDGPGCELLRMTAEPKAGLRSQEMLRMRTLPDALTWRGPSLELLRSRLMPAVALVRLTISALGAVPAGNVTEPCRCSVPPRSKDEMRTPKSRLICASWSFNFASISIAMAFIAIKLACSLMPLSPLACASQEDSS
mmetsp:Transcript_56112/g.182063  ORF Transcript_56112/g.182063 Transcript_56112/m.182063 type:complete len:222 (+) Transcript_56112:1059-1724(+)